MFRGWRKCLKDLQTSRIAETPSFEDERVMSGEMGKVIPYKEPGKSSTNSWFQPVWKY